MKEVIYMKRIRFILTVFLVTSVILPVFAQEKEGVTYRQLPVKEYRDKMKAGWIGQIAGVCLGGPTEFRWQDAIIPENEMPVWTPEMINSAFGQDDLYVEMTFLRSMEEYGLDVPIRQAGIDFANSEYQLWCANHAGRRNLRRGIAPPDSSHPQFSSRGNDIDYQIEADFSGLISPGMPNNAIKMGEKFGRLMNYSDGMYAGQFMGAMYAEAFFETDRVKIVEAGLKAIPAGSQYAEMVRDMLAWYRENPDDWQAAWQKCQKKYREDPEYQQFSNGGIDVKINGAYVLMGLLFGNGDLDQTMIISTRCGQDSDCNPSSSAGVLFTTVGFSKLPARFSEKLDETAVFSHTAYNFPALIDVCEKLARQALEQAGGFIKEVNGEEVFFIPVLEPVPSPLVFCWDPEPIANSRFTEEEYAKIKFPEEPLEEMVQREFGFELTHLGPDMNPHFLGEWRGKQHVLLTHPESLEVGCYLKKELRIEEGKSTLKMVVSHFTDSQVSGDWELIVRVDGKTVCDEVIGPDSVDADGWKTV
ncbi:MAG: ADP-ribosylglycohydrolase family protein, partial [Thermoguttaceae bacterium]|nr:ADP-ribosylglycohydrolase family protein [Thermoguttaceae bacterium]